jgi:hypothetical protein
LITNFIDRFAGTRFPFSRQAMTAMPYCQRRFAVARLMPNSQQIDFHGLRLARSQTIRASSFSSQRSQMSASSASVMSRGLGRGRRIFGSWPT